MKRGDQWIRNYLRPIMVDKRWFAAQQLPRDWSWLWRGLRVVAEGVAIGLTMLVFWTVFFYVLSS